MNANILKKAFDLVDSVENGYFAHMDSDGFPHVATRSKISSKGIEEFYFATDTSGSMATGISKDSRASICLRKDNNNVTVIGEAVIVTDQAVKESLWLDWFINHFPLGPSDPEYCIIKFITKKVSLWVDGEIAKFSMEEARRVTSRCGLLCQTCEWKEPYHCNECITSMGHPFHGECPIAICCQDRGFIHCGQCPEMPCSKLYEYSCGEGEHCDKPKGARLDVLKMWE